MIVFSVRWRWAFLLSPCITFFCLIVRKYIAIDTMRWYPSSCHLWYAIAMPVFTWYDTTCCDMMRVGIWYDTFHSDNITCGDTYHLLLLLFHHYLKMFVGLFHRDKLLIQYSPFTIKSLPFVSGSTVFDTILRDIRDDCFCLFVPCLWKHYYWWYVMFGTDTIVEAIHYKWPAITWKLIHTCYWLMIVR